MFIRLRYAKSVKFLPDGRHVAIGGIALARFDLATMKISDRLDIASGNPISRISISPKGSRLVYVAGQTTGIVDTANFRDVGPEYRRMRGTGKLRFSKNGNYLITIDSVDSLFFTWKPAFR